METDLGILFEVAVYLTDKEARKQAQAVKDAIAEITLLRAGQFRWIAVSDAPDNGVQVLVVFKDRSITSLNSSSIPSYPNITHWAPIPPLPERTQEEKDEALWKQYADKNNFLSCAGEHNLRYGFLAGLKAARGEK